MEIQPKRSGRESEERTPSTRPTLLVSHFAEVEVEVERAEEACRKLWAHSW